MKQCSPKKLPLNVLKECLEIDPSSKTWLRWKVRPRSHFNCDWMYEAFKKKAGTEAGSLQIRNGKSYASVFVSGMAYQISRVVFAIANDTDPYGMEVDHIDRNRFNNDPRNLRLVTGSQNCQNRNRRRDNSSGEVGISWHKRDKKWQSYIAINGKMINLGMFKDKNDAIKARDSAEREIFGAFSPKLSTSKNEA